MLFTQADFPILGLRKAEIDAARCYLTVGGMRRLRPCKWALQYMKRKGTQEVTPELFERWRSHEPYVWLSGVRWGAYGPTGRWGWDFNVSARTSNENMCRMLKAYIMRRGRRE
jgi:hypothetical protein